MASLNQLVYDIKNIAQGGFQSDDVAVSDRQIAYWINQERALLIAQLLSASKSIPESVVQHLECVELECLDPAECCDISTTERVLRSTQKLPKTIHRNNRNSILGVSSVDKLVSFSETNYFRQRTNNNSKYTKGKPRWFIKNDYMYLTNTKILEYVSVSGIFEDPTEALLFKTCENEPCWTWDDEYPITSRLSSILTSKILKEKMGVTLNAPNDQSNNAKEDDIVRPRNEKG